MSRTTLKLLFLLTALFLLAVLFMWPGSNSDKLSLTTQKEQIGEQFKDTRVEDVGATTIIEPSFTGRDFKNRHWKISAQKAKQESRDGQDEIWLDTVKAKASGANGREISFDAGYGYYNKQDSIMRLEDGVIVKGYGFTLEIPELESNLQQQTARGSGNVKISSSGGELFAKQFEILHNGEIVRLTGGVKGVFYPQMKQVQQPSSSQIQQNSEEK